MNIAAFATENFFAQYEFKSPYQLCNSDCETVTVEELLKLAALPIEHFGSLSLGYTQSLGNPILRESIAESYSRVSTDAVVMLGSPVEGIYLVARAALNPGDEVILMSPAYDALINVFEHIVGCSSVRRWEFIPSENQWELDYDHLKHLITSRTKMVVVNFPHNPTGYLPAQDQLNELVKLVNDHGLLLFCDEMYFGLVHSGTSPITSVADLTKRAVVLSGLSKTYGLPGLRTGWLIIHDQELRQNIINWKFYTSICPPAPSEFLALAAWKVREKLRARSIAQIEINLGLAEEFFLRWSDLFKWRKPMAGSTALVGMNVQSVLAFATRLAEETGVLILPAVTLGTNDKHMRMGFGRSAFGEALNKFEEYLNLRKNQPNN